MPDVRVPAEDLRRLLGLWDACEAAERHFHSCQSAQYRSFLRSVWDAPNMHAAVDSLEEAVRTGQAEGEDVGTAGEDQPKNSQAQSPEAEGEGAEDGA